MVKLTCPLCCDETFPTPASLSCHIWSVLENLACPQCERGFATLADLAGHLEECAEGQESPPDDPPGEEPGQEAENSEVRGESILARALKGGCQESKGEEAQYYCQMCNVHFDGIEEHLTEFHEGQEVILEEEGSNEASETLSDVHTILIIDAPDEDTEKAVTESTDTPKTSPSKKTVVEEEFKDSEGRLYTRKFVKIDKFWLEKDPLTRQNKESIEINKCPTCKLYFTNPEEFQNHTCTLKKDIKSPDSTLTFKDEETPKEHPKSHAKQEKKNPAGPFNCETCNTVFPTFKSLRLHRRMHDPIKVREVEAPSKYGLYENDVSEEQVRQMFICKVCNKTYDKQYETVHMNSHNNTNLNCDICNRKFCSKANLDMHHKVHSNNKKFTCSYCKKPFVTYDSLNEHLLNQCQKRPYACQFCGRRFARPHEKVKHERIHTGEKPHVCDICGKAFRVSYCLTLHLRTHSGTRPYQCKHCGKRFKSHSVYNHHTLTHSEVRAYKCPFCPKAFKTGVQLAGHKNSHVKPFACTECNRPFASLYAVRAHMETHKRGADSGLKHECWTCGALYSRAFALRDHLRQQHRQEEAAAADSILVAEEDLVLGLDVEGE